MQFDVDTPDGRAGLWSHVWRMFGFDCRPGLLQELEYAYAEPHRHYHNQIHLAECLARLQTWWPQANRPHEVCIALWFHDAVYEPKEAENELKSAAWAARELAQAGVGSASVQRVYDLIMSTAHAQGNGISDADAQLVHDIDLAILGSSEARYEQYAQDVGKEFAFVGEKFRAGRCAVLQSFLAKPSIYLLPCAAAELEAQARINILDELTSLR